MQDFHNLIVWQKSHRLVLELYQISSGFPRHELYSLTSQIRRSAASIPTNIAEGCGRGTEAEFAHFLQISMGSASELEYRLLLSRELQYLDSTNHLELEAQVTEVKRMLASLIRKLKPDR